MSFIEATRQNIRQEAVKPYTASQNVSHDLARTGLISRIFLHFVGTLTCTHASKTTFTKAAEAPYNLAGRIRLTLNSGTDVYNVSGYGTYLMNMINRINYYLDNASCGVFAFGNTVSSSGTDNNVEFFLEIPVAANDRDALGMLMLQSSQIVATLNIENNAASVLMTDTDITTALTGNWYVSTEKFSIPAKAEDYPNLDTIHQVIEDVAPISATGRNRFVIPRGNTYMKLIDIIKLNGAANSADVEDIALKINTSNEPYNMTGRDIRAMQAQRYGRALPTGVFVYDFTYSMGLPGLGNFRDFIDSQDVSEFDQIINIASGATLGSNNNTVRTIREMLVAVSA